MRTLYNRVVPAIALATVIATVFVSRIVLAQEKPTPSPIYACADKVTGSLRRTSGPGQCNTTLENPAQWYEFGAQGPPGPPGSRGARGPAGPSGPRGTAILWTGSSMAENDPQLSHFEDKIIGEMSVDPGSYFITATVVILPDGEWANLAQATCQIEAAGGTLDEKTVSGPGGSGVIDQPLRQILTLHGVRDGVNLIRVRCRDSQAAPAMWQFVQLNALQLTDARQVELGTN